MDARFRWSTENLEKLNSSLCYKPSKPLLYPNCNRYKNNNNRLQTYNRKPRPLYGFNEIRQYKQRGIVFVWPQPRRFFKTKEITFLAWFLAHTLYWLHAVHFLPSGAVLPLNQPPWNIRQPIPKPENRDYIIEPDWDSLYL